MSDCRFGVSPVNYPDPDPELNDHLSGKEVFVRFTARAFRKLLSVYVFSYFPFSFEGREWDLLCQFLIIAYLFTLS